MDNSYKTPAGYGEAELIEKRSRFIARIAPVSTEDEAASFVAEIRERHRDASHNVYAYSLRREGLTKCTDDGEPAGTAGMPVLETLTKREIFDAVIVITRYFGGTLLGTGGLVRAYSQAASLAVDAAGVSQMSLCERYSLVADYAQYESVERVIASLGGRTLSCDFSDRVYLELLLPAGAFEPFSDKLRALFKAQPDIKKLGEGFFSLA